MERKKQNIIIFYEENNDEKDISSKLVRLYMNRFLIGEDDQSELSGVYDLAQNTQPNENTPLVEFSSIWKQKDSKLKNGKTVFLESVSKIFESEKLANRSRGPQFVNSYKIHFIVGTSWNINASGLKRILLQNIVKSMIKQAWQTDQTKEFGERKVSNLVTLLRGSHSQSCGDSRVTSYNTVLTYCYKTVIYSFNCGRYFSFYCPRISVYRKLLTTEQLKSTHARSKDGEELINDDLEGIPADTSLTALLSQSDSG